VEKRDWFRCGSRAYIKKKFVTFTKKHRARENCRGQNSILIAIYTGGWEEKVGAHFSGRLEIHLG